MPSTKLGGVSRYVSVPLAGVGVSLLVLRGSFHRVEHVLLALSTVFVTYIASGFLATPTGAGRPGCGVRKPERS
jgi:Mn2+/Fe2+ NRAMP family transporter